MPDIKGVEIVFFLQKLLQKYVFEYFNPERIILKYFQKHNI